MPELVLPGVYIEVRAEALIVSGPISVGNIGIVGTARQGPLSEVITLSAYAQAKENFGAYDDYKKAKAAGGKELTLVRALELAYANGASTVLAVRVSSSGNTQAKSAIFKVLGETAGTTGATLEARTPGDWGNGIAINVTDAEEDSFTANEEHIGAAPITLKRKPVAEDPRNSVRVLLGATGQTKVFNVVYAAPSAGQVQINKTSGVLTFATGEAPIAGDKTLASYVVPKANSRKVSIRYGAVTEVYTVADSQQLVDLVNSVENPDARSVFVKGTAGPNAGEIPKKQADANDFREFGKGTDTPGSNGENASATDYKEALEKLLNEDAHIIVAAGQGTDFADELKSHVEGASTDKIRRDRIAVVGSGENAALNKILGHPVASERVIFVAPGIQTTDAASGKDVTLPGSYAAAVIAGMLSARDPHISLTNKALSVGGLETKFNPGELEQMVKNRVLALEERRGFRVVRGVTSDSGAFQQITTRRIVDFAKFGVRGAAEPFIGLLNNNRVRQALKGSINGFLAGMVDDEMLTSYELDVTATREEEIRGIAKVTLTLRPTFSIDYIKVVMFLG